MKTNIKLSAILFTSLMGCMVSNFASANVTFLDSTFNLSDYSISKYQTDGTDVKVSQTSSGNPGTALQIDMHVPRTFESVIHATQYIINTTFRYDPSVQGAINSIDASADFRGEIFQNGTSVPFNPVGGSKGGLQVLINQGGHLYSNTLGVAGPPVVLGDSFNSGHSIGLKATDFGLLTDFSTVVVDKTQHPSFTNGILELGISTGIYGKNLFGFPETNAVATFDNLSFTVAAVPEPETYAMLLAGLGLIGFLGRQKSQFIDQQGSVS
ncbi:PEP-CTERM sorting domain-containing protein [Nitrosospira sp. NRS527]|uniref:PEP-CTERM sorting domain-containing protein n=1 Tax=Nitrosospira sp. NRS527 TaxID=155925 RepID=UPI001FD1D9EF|nr:PEP-CTERM sorting domain-containing protein [Nitrosospira sp. NRS527]